MPPVLANAPDLRAAARPPLAGVGRPAPGAPPPVGAVAGRRPSEFTQVVEGLKPSGPPPAPIAAPSPAAASRAPGSAPPSARPLLVVLGVVLVLALVLLLVLLLT
jgi:hypothetical protein